MSTLPADFVTLTRQLRRLRRLTVGASVVGAVGFAVATVALVAPYNPELRSQVEQVLRRVGAAAAETPGGPRKPAPRLAAVEDDGFVLRSRDGHVRARLAIDESDRPTLTLFEGEETSPTTSRMQLSPIGVSISGAMGDEKIEVYLSPNRIALSDSQGGNANLMVLGDRAELSLKTKEDEKVELAARRLGANDAFEKLSPHALAQVHSGQWWATLGAFSDYANVQVEEDNVSDPREGRRGSLQVGHGGELALELSDSMKSGVSRTILGTASLEKTQTGGTERTGPASLVLFDKKGKVIFRAPRD